MADPIGFYNSHYTGGEIDAAVGQIENKLDKPSGLDTAYRIVTTNNSSTGILAYTNVPTGSTVMQRDTNGRAQIEAGTSGKEIVNFDQLQAAIKTTYRHHLKITAQYEPGFYIDFTSSSDTQITSLEALLALSSTLGETVPAYGTAGQGSDRIVVNYATLTSTGGLTGMSTFPKITTIKWTNFTSIVITDTVKEI